MGWVRHTCLVASVIVALAFSCDDGGGGGPQGGGGAGGCIYGPPEALFNLTLRVEEGPLPADLTIKVSWSAGEEPIFVLGDKSTWKTLEDGSNVACDVDHSGPPPTDLEELHCELWTSGTTEVEVTGGGFAMADETLMPKVVDGCDIPVPSSVTVELVVDHDAGPG